MEENWLKKRKVILFFALVALIGGVLFLEPIITGNAISERGIEFGSISLIGFLLILCSVILTAYSINKK